MKSPQKDLCTSIFPSSTQEHFQFGSTFCNHSLPFGSDKATAASCTLKSQMKHGKNFATAVVLSQLDGICTMEKKRKKKELSLQAFSPWRIVSTLLATGESLANHTVKEVVVNVPLHAKNKTKQNWRLRLNVTDVNKSKMVKVPNG